MGSAVKYATKVLRAISIVVWLSIIVASISGYLAYPQLFTAENIAAFMQRFEGEIWLVYLAFSALRGFTLLPSTPLVLAGTMLYPTQPLLVLTISITGILLSSSMIYFFSEFLGFSDYFENHNPALTHKIRQKLERPTGFLFVAVWAFFPLVPTDVVCYVAGTTKMNFFKFIGAVFVGELILCLFYVYSGNYLFSRWR